MHMAMAHSIVQQALSAATRTRLSSGDARRQCQPCDCTVRDRAVWLRQVSGKNWKAHVCNQLL